jgi:ABC-type multidrug transport system fused ATPase/permease subunit
LRQINAKRHELAGELASLEKINEIFEESNKYQNIISGKRSLNSLQSSIRFQQVNFAYNEKKVVLHDITFSIGKNEMIALVGPSGGGKSTIVDLVIRLIDPDSGRIMIDDSDLRDLDLNQYHRKIGYVGQESLIFNDTVMNNICYAIGSCSPEKAKEAAMTANAHDFIMHLPQQYDTILGERGVTLSGGQKQRIALARAIYKQPEILILDEATSSLDSESEKIILEAIKKIRHSITIIAIAHRLSTIENADSIVVIEDGNIVESGTHEELLASGNTYKRYYELQHSRQREIQ